MAVPLLNLSALDVKILLGGGGGVEGGVLRGRGRRRRISYLVIADILRVHVSSIPRRGLAEVGGAGAEAAQVALLLPRVLHGQPALARLRLRASQVQRLEGGVRGDLKFVCLFVVTWSWLLVTW